MFQRILSSSIAAAALAVTSPALADHSAFASGEGLDSHEQSHDGSASIATSAFAFADDSAFASGEGLGARDLGDERPSVSIDERISMAVLGDGEQVRAAYEASLVRPARGRDASTSTGSGGAAPAARQLGSDPLDRSMDAGG
jgi:hypothetical protein